MQYPLMGLYTFSFSQLPPTPKPTGSNMIFCVLKVAKLCEKMHGICYEFKPIWSFREFHLQVRWVFNVGPNIPSSKSNTDNIISAYETHHVISNDNAQKCWAPVLAAQTRARQRALFAIKLSLGLFHAYVLWLLWCVIVTLFHLLRVSLLLSLVEP